MTVAWILAALAFVVVLIIGIVIGWCARGLLTETVTYGSYEDDDVGGN